MVDVAAGLSSRADDDTRTLQMLAIHVVSDNVGLRDGLMELARSHATGPVCFNFSQPSEGLQPLLEPGLDALIVDIGFGAPAEFAFLRRVISLGPDAPVIAVGAEDSNLQMRAISAGAEDCLGTDLEAPRALVLAIRRAIARRGMREIRRPETVKPQAEPQQVTLIQETSEAMVILDSQGHVRFANGAAEELLGRGVGELIGQPFGLPSEVGEHEVAVMRPDGDNRYAEMRIVDTRWGGLPARVAALNDVTVRRKLERTMQVAEAQSRETKKRSQSFFSNVNHDLRTPLTHIIGFSELMKNEQFGPIGQDRYRDYANDIHSSGTMLLDMIEDLLGIAEAETDQIDLTNEICNLGQLLEIAAASQRARANAQAVKLEIDCPAKLPGLRGDARRLRQGLFRMIAEAIHSARHGATLTLGVHEEADRIVVTVSETSPSADDTSAQNRLPYLADDPFVSTENSGAARSESLALSLTRKVMELHGGSLNVAQGSAQPISISLTFPAERTIR
ncbi:MAG TPA: histidine kinase dimerization/phospho-acceptor domain-containing protein [Parvibaculum sp.]|jgi:signal transduction histidine kinase